MEWTPDEYRDSARRWCEYACNGAKGRRLRDPVYQRITEGRDIPGTARDGYSSCGDLAHWLLYKLGVRSAWLNRAEHLGFRSGMNLARLCPRPQFTNPWARKARGEEVFHTGDILIIWDERRRGQPNYTLDGHALVVDRHEGRTLHSWDFGQGPMGPRSPQANYIEGQRRTRPLTFSGGLWVAPDGRSIQSVLSLSEVLEAAKAAGELAAPTPFVGEVLDKIEGLI